MTYFIRLSWHPARLHLAHPRSPPLRTPASLCPGDAVRSLSLFARRCGHRTPRPEPAFIATRCRNNAASTTKPNPHYLNWFLRRRPSPEHLCRAVTRARVCHCFT